MKRSAVVLTVCHLALNGALPGYAGSAHAIPAGQNRFLEDSRPLADFSAVAKSPEPTSIATLIVDAGHAESPATTPDNTNTLTDNNDNNNNNELNESAIPCMVSFEDEYATAESCDDNTAEKQLSVRFGQRMGTDTSSILGEFDGIRVDYRLAGGLRLNGVAGYRVLSDNDKFNAARQVYGVSANTATFAHAWDLNSYLVEEQDNGQAARRNTGGALRYLRPKRSLLLLFDYDLAESSLDGFTASGALRLPRSTTLSAIFDMRNNPLRRQQLKYVQKTMAITDGWTWNLPMDRIGHYTRDLSEEVTTLAVGLTHTFSSQLKVTGSAARLDVSRDDTGAMAPSEYFYHLRFSGNDLMFPGNSNTLDLSHSITQSTRTSSASLDTRYTINRRWKVSPRLRTDYRDNIQDRSVQWATAPSVRMEYQWRERYGVKIEAGGEWVTRELTSQADSDMSYFVKLGYKMNF